MEDLKLKSSLTRQDINDLLEAIGPPGEKREEKIEAVKELDKANFQGFALHDSLDSYGAY